MQTRIKRQRKVKEDEERKTRTGERKDEDKYIHIIHEEVHGTIVH